jgi:hypothetical protein
MAANDTINSDSETRRAAERGHWAPEIIALDMLSQLSNAGYFR